jgi:glucose-1-phosphate cytidylyltransferase
MKALILAGGKGSRMCAASTNLPKPLVPIGGIPIICHIMHYFQTYGVHEFIIAVGYQSEQVITVLREYLEPVSKTIQTVESQNCTSLHCPESNLLVQLVETGVDTHTGGRIKRVRPFLDEESFYLAWCDGLSDMRLDNMLAFHKKHGRLATVAAVHPMSRFGIMELSNGEVISFQEKPRMIDRWVNSGYSILEPEALDSIHSDDEQWETGPVRRLIQEHQLMAWQHEGQWQCMDTVGDWQYLENLWNAGSAFWKPERKS